MYEHAFATLFLSQLYGMTHARVARRRSEAEGRGRLHRRLPDRDGRLALRAVHDRVRPVGHRLPGAGAARGARRRHPGAAVVHRPRRRLRQGAARSRTATEGPLLVQDHGHVREDEDVVRDQRRRRDRASLRRASTTTRATARAVEFLEAEYDDDQPVLRHALLLLVRQLLRRPGVLPVRRRRAGSATGSGWRATCSRGSTPTAAGTTTSAPATSSRRRWRCLMLQIPDGVPADLPAIVAAQPQCQ